MGIGLFTILFPGFLGGAIALSFGLAGRTIDERIRCGACRFDLSGCAGGRCPECGAPLVRGSVVRGKRQPRRWLMVVGVMLMVPWVVHVGLIVASAVFGFDHMRYLPTNVLIDGVRESDDWVGGRAATEIERRHSAGELSQQEVNAWALVLAERCEEQSGPFDLLNRNPLVDLMVTNAIEGATVDQIVQDGLALQADRDRPWSALKGDVIEAAIQAGFTSDAQQAAYFENMLAPELVFGGAEPFVAGQRVRVSLWDGARCGTKTQVFVALSMPGLETRSYVCVRRAGWHTFGFMTLPEDPGEHVSPATVGYRFVPRSAFLSPRAPPLLPFNELRDGSLDLTKHPAFHVSFRIDQVFEVVDRNPVSELPPQVDRLFRSGLFLENAPSLHDRDVSGSFEMVGIDEPLSMTLSVIVRQDGRSWRTTVACEVTQGNVVVKAGGTTFTTGSSGFSDFRIGYKINSTGVKPGRADLVFRIDSLTMPERGLDLEDVGYELVFPDLPF